MQLSQHCQQLLTKSLATCREQQGQRVQGCYSPSLLSLQTPSCLALIVIGAGVLSLQSWWPAQLHQPEDGRHCAKMRAKEGFSLCGARGREGSRCARDCKGAAHRYTLPSWGFTARCQWTKGTQTNASISIRYCCHIHQQVNKTPQFSANC